MTMTGIRRAVAAKEKDGIPAGSARTDWRPLGDLLVCTFLIVLDFFIVNVALPSIQHDLHASSAALEWVVAGYGLTFAVLVITGGRLGDRFGRRRVLRVGILVFVVASAACGLAPTATSLVAARFIQGVGAALISPSVLSLIGVLYGGTHRVKAITAYGLVLGLAATSGQVVGGALIQADVAGSAWRTIFLVNVPIGIAALTVARKVVPESKAEHPGGLDVVGIVLATIGLSTLVLPLVEGRQLGWPTWTWICLATCPLVLAVLARHQRALARNGREPLLHPAVFKDSRLRAGLAVQVLCWCSQSSFFLVLALYLQEGRGLSPLDSGMMFMILSGAFVLVSLRAPALTARYGRDLIMAGALAVALGDAVLLSVVTLSGTSGNLALLAPGLILVGVGQAAWITPLTSTVLAHCDPQRAGLVSGTLSTMQQVGNSLGVAVIGVLYFSALRSGYSTAFSHALVGLIAGLVVSASVTRLMPNSKRNAPTPLGQ